MLRSWRNLMSKFLVLILLIFVPYITYAAWVPERTPCFKEMSRILAERDFYKDGKFASRFQQPIETNYQNRIGVEIQESTDGSGTNIEIGTEKLANGLLGSSMTVRSRNVWDGVPESFTVIYSADCSPQEIKINGGDAFSVSKCSSGGIEPYPNQYKFKSGIVCSSMDRQRIKSLCNQILNKKSNNTRSARGSK